MSTTDKDKIVKAILPLPEGVSPADCYKRAKEARDQQPVNEVVIRPTPNGGLKVSGTMHNLLGFKLSLPDGWELEITNK